MFLKGNSAAVNTYAQSVFEHILSFKAFIYRLFITIPNLTFAINKRSVNKFRDFFSASFSTFRLGNENRAKNNLPLFASPLCETLRMPFKSFNSTSLAWPLPPT